MPEARAVWELYKTLVNKPLKDATRDDGRVLVAHFEQQGNKSATIQKKLSWLVAACNFAIREGRLEVQSVLFCRAAAVTTSCGG